MKTVVVFRRFKDGGDVVALFPYEKWDERGNRSSYQRIGQHGAADYKGLIGVTTLAKPNEYAALKKELESIGYDLLIRRRAK